MLYNTAPGWEGGSVCKLPSGCFPAAASLLKSDDGSAAHESTAVSSCAHAALLAACGTARRAAVGHCLVCVQSHGRCSDAVADSFCAGEPAAAGESRPTAAVGIIHRDCGCRP